MLLLLLTLLACTPPPDRPEDTPQTQDSGLDSGRGATLTGPLVGPSAWPEDGCSVFDMQPWEEMPQRLSRASYAFVSAVAEDVIIVVSGRDTSSSTRTFVQWARVGEDGTFGDGEERPFALAPDIPVPVSDGSGFWHQGTLYVLGGWEPAVVVYDEIWAIDFDPKTEVWGEWQVVGRLPEARYYHNSVVVGDRVYLVGGAGTMNAAWARIGEWDWQVLEDARELPCSGCQATRGGNGILMQGSGSVYEFAIDDDQGLKANERVVESFVDPGKGIPVTHYRDGLIVAMGWGSSPANEHTYVGSWRTGLTNMQRGPDFPAVRHRHDIVVVGDYVFGLGGTETTGEGSERAKAEIFRASLCQPM